MSKISQANLSWRFYDWQASEIFPSSDFQPRKCQYLFLSLESVLEGGKTMPQICQWNYRWLMSIMTNCNTLPLLRFFICLFSLHSFLSVFLSLSLLFFFLSPSLTQLLALWWTKSCFAGQKQCLRTLPFRHGNRNTGLLWCIIWFIS